MSDEAVPASPSHVVAPHGLERLALPPGLTPSDVADLLFAMPNLVEGLEWRDVTTTADSATVVYLAGEDGSMPRFGMCVVLIVEPSADADAFVAKLKTDRWGPESEHTVTSSGAGEEETPAFREFWRVFPPGLFAIPNQPVYFLIAYRAGDTYAFMVIGGSPSIRRELAMALAETLVGDG